MRIEDLEKDSISIVSEGESQIQEEWAKKTRSTQEDQKKNQLKPTVIARNSRVAKDQTVQIVGKDEYRMDGDKKLLILTELLQWTREWQLGFAREKNTRIQDREGRSSQGQHYRILSNSLGENSIGSKGSFSTSVLSFYKLINLFLI